MCSDSNDNFSPFEGVMFTKSCLLLKIRLLCLKSSTSDAIQLGSQSGEFVVDVQDRSFKADFDFEPLA